MDDLKAIVRSLKEERRHDIDVVLAPCNVDIDDKGRLVHEGRTYAFTPRSYKQWCRKVGVPDDFMRRCPSGTGAASKKAIFDHFKASKDKSVMVRLRPGKERNVVRAVLPGNYAAYDNAELLTRLATFAGETGMNVEQFAISGGDAQVRLTHPKRVNIGRMPDGTPDEHRFGYVFRNSEVGSYPDVRGQFLTYRLACTNGAIMSSALMGDRKGRPLLSFRHTNHDVNAFITGLETSFVTFTNMVPRAKDAIEKAQATLLSKQQVENQLNKLLARLNIGDAFDSNVVKEFRREPIMSRFGVVQALTAAARACHPDERALVEEIAGDYVLSTVQ